MTSTASSLSLTTMSIGCQTTVTVTMLVGAIRLTMAGGWPDVFKPLVNLTLETVTASSATLKWALAANHSDSGLILPMTSRLAVYRLPRIHQSRASGSYYHAELLSAVETKEELTIDVTAASGWYQLDELVPGAVYSAQLVAEDAETGSLINVSNFVLLNTNVNGGVAMKINQFRMHPAEVAVVVLILAAWAVAVFAFLHKWRRLRIVPSREPRYKHAPPKNLDAVQVVAKPDDSVIYKSYTRQLSTTMEARRSRLERMQTMPNIKLTGSPGAGGASRGKRLITKSVLDATSEEDGNGGGNDSACTPVPPVTRKRTPSLLNPFVKQKSEGRLLPVSSGKSEADVAGIMKGSLSVNTPPATNRRSSMFAEAGGLGFESVRNLVFTSVGRSNRRRQSVQNLQPILSTLSTVAYTVREEIQLPSPPLSAPCHGKLIDVDVCLERGATDAADETDLLLADNGVPPDDVIKPTRACDSKLTLTQLTEQLQNPVATDSSENDLFPVKVDIDCDQSPCNSNVDHTPLLETFDSEHLPRCETDL